MSSLTLGMPNLTYHGLDHIWLSKHLGNEHWKLLGNGPAMTKNNERLYASFFCCEINFNQGQHLYQEGDTVDINSTLFKFNTQIYRSVHTIKNDQNLTTATFDSIFVKKDINKNILVRDDPHSNVNDIAKTDCVFIDEHKRIKQELRTHNLGDAAIKLQFNPETYFNGVKILYFANYLSLVSQSEFLFYPEIKSPIKKIMTYYFSNITPSDEVFGITLRDQNQYTTHLLANNKVIATCTILR